MRALSFVCSVWLLVVAAGCDGDARLLVVEVRTDYLAGEEFASVSVRVTPEGGAPLETRFDDLGQPFDRGVRVAELELSASTAVVQVDLRDASGGVLVGRPVLVDLSSDQSATVVLSRRCEGVTCGADEACALGRCVSSRCTEESPEACGEPECDAATDCTDGPACVAAECTATGGCFHAPDDASCGPAERCHPTRGCELASGPTDAGMPDAGMPDAGEMCPETPCRLVAPQCGCAPGDGCHSSSGTLSCGAAGTSDESEVCMGPGECAPGLLCVRRGDRPEGDCRPYCVSDGDCDSVPCGSLMGTMYGACASPCDPLAQTGCAAGQGCHAVLASALPLDGSSVMMTQCSTDSGMPTGSACTASADCSAGDVCTGMGCLTLCDLDGAPCPSFGFCSMLMMDLTFPMGGRVGVCLPTS